ncbi:MAG: hypothetical protein HGA79_00450 [Anaerolineales bacterium]|nr:hypothetical protein [Anaerolineales bacterium]NTW11920.1 hypothetical protein [Anaerolineales bacterium]
MKARIFVVMSLALILALLASSLPMGSTTTAQGEVPNCPPVSLLQGMDSAFVKSLPLECQQKNRQPAAPQSRTLNQFTLLSTGGPDDFGYTYDDTVPFNWVSASVNSGVAADEGNSSPFFDIGFAFPFYGSNYSQLSFSTNGFVKFDLGSACCYWTSTVLPDPALPNNIIAVFWDDLVVGDIYNTGAIFYEKGGVAPDRYLVLEWRDVTTYSGTDPFSFEVILYENGDILIQHQSLPGSYYATVGTENELGDDGLNYHAGDTGLSAPKAIKFTYPTAPTARLQVSPLSSGKFASNVTNTNFPVTIKNNGSAGTDTYDLYAYSSWPFDLYHDGCIMPLTDTDADTVIDTGPLPEGSSTTICIGFTPPAGSNVGDTNYAWITVTSSLDSARSKQPSFRMAIPTSFAHVFEDYTNAAMAFRVNQPESTLTNYVTDDFYFANGPATIGLPDGRYLYAWRKPDGNFSDAHSDIEFTFLSNDGSTSTPVAKLTNNVGTGQTYDYDPSVAVTPNGTIGVLWRRWLVDNSTGLYNYNIFFASMSNTGALLSGPVNITNNNLWDNLDDINVPHYFSPSIAGTGDNRFVLSWQDYRTNGTNIFNSYIWFSTLEPSGVAVFAPAQLPIFGYSYAPILNPSKEGNAILTFIADEGVSFHPYYAVITSNGTLAKPVTNLDPGGLSFPEDSPDAVALSNGNTAVAWPTSSGVILSILDPGYNSITGPIIANNLFASSNATLSITNDAEDRIVMTWTDSSASQLFYSLADSNGTFITYPIPAQTSTISLITSRNGQGNAPYPLVVQKNVLDDFNRANGTIGADWFGNKSRYRILDNQLHVRYYGSNTDMFWKEKFGADQEAFITLVNVSENATSHGLLLKAQSNRTWGNGVIEVVYNAREQVVQVWTWEWPKGWVKYGSNIPVTFVDGDTFSARALSDGTVEVYRNGALLGTRDVTSWRYYASGGYIGLWFIGAGDAIIDDFGSGTIP